MKRLLVAVLMLSGGWSQSPGFGADIFLTRDGAGARDGSDWANALPATELDSAFRDRLAPGDRMMVGGGDYGMFSAVLSGGGIEGAPKSLIGVDLGEGLPVWRGEWKAERPGEGGTALRLEAGTVAVVVEGLIFENFQNGISVAAARDGESASRGLRFSSLTVRGCRHGFFLSDIDDLMLEKCVVHGSTKHAFRFDRGCRQVRVSDCEADAARAGEGWEDRTESLPFGFFVNESGGASGEQTGFRFERCVSVNHRMRKPPGRYPNGDGFVVEEGVGEVSFLRCIALDNEDGGFDLKPDGVELVDCIAVGNSRGFRLWGTGRLENCFAGWGETGVWINGGEVSVDRSTFRAMAGEAVLSDDRASGSVKVARSLLVDCREDARSTARGKVDFANDVVQIRIEGAPSGIVRGTWQGDLPGPLLKGLPRDAGFRAW